MNIFDQVTQLALNAATMVLQTDLENADDRLLALFAVIQRLRKKELKR